MVWRCVCLVFVCLLALAVGFPMTIVLLPPPLVSLEGAYGVVAAAHDNQSGDEVAVKRIRSVLETYPMATRILREVKFNRMLRGHENLVQLRDLLLPSDVRTFQDTFLVFDVMPCDLSKVINSKARLNSDNIKFLMFQLLRGLLYLHRANVLHRDLKPSNLLVDGDCMLKICDLGYVGDQFFDVERRVFTPLRAVCAARCACTWPSERTSSSVGAGQLSSSCPLGVARSHAVPALCCFFCCVFVE